MNSPPINPQPPRWAHRLLTWLHPTETLEEVEGDLDELYTYWYRRSGRTQATWRYVLNVFSVLPPFVRRRQAKQDYSQPSIRSAGMLQNYLKIAWRNLWRNPLYSLLNIGGLAIGLVVSLLILLFVAHERSYDRFHSKADRIYRVWARFQFGDQTIQTQKMSARVGPVVKENLPGVEQVVRVYETQRAKLRSDHNHLFMESNFWMADPTFFAVFDVNLIAGNQRFPVAQPMTLVLSERMAQKYFGHQNPIGRTLTYNEKLTFTVTGIMQNAPSNSSLQCDFVTNIDNLCTVERVIEHRIQDDAGCSLQFNGISLGAFTTYFLVKDKRVAQQIPAKIDALLKASRKQGLDGTGDSYFVQSLSDIHLGTNFGDTANTRLVNVFTLVGLLVLALALINYMNLATARATVRAKEVGVRKASGASRRSIARQFYTESSLTTLLAFCVALLLVIALKPTFLNLLNLQIDNTFWQQPSFIAAILCLVALCVLLAGSYPALVLSSFNPVAVLAGRFRFRSGGWVRRFLTVFQYGASVALVICTIVIQQQVRFFRTKDVGLRKAQVIGIEFSGSMAPNIGVFRRQIRQLAVVGGVTMSSSSLFKNGNAIFFIRSPLNKREVSLEVIDTDTAFVHFFQLGWKNVPTDRNRLGSPQTVILNETAAKQLGYLGPLPKARLRIGGDEKGVEVIGILKDFNNASLQQAIQPLAVFARPAPTFETAGQGGCLYIRLNPQADIDQTLAQIGNLYQQLDPETPFSYYFLDQAFADLHKSEFRLARMFSTFMVVSVLIACLGLFGLVTFAAEQRTKEIGVRKVLGASVTSIVTLLSKDFLKLVVIAIVIAGPIAYYAMNRWLQDFAYRIQLEWWVFALAGALAVGIALLTVSYQSIKAALVNPVKSLRSE